jgi:hypothetical protein
VRFSVVTAWRGVDTREVTVSTHRSSAMCGYPFQEGEEYLVYARGGEGLTVSLCSRTAPLADAGEDLAALGAGEPGSALAPPEPEDRSLLERAGERGWPTAVVVAAMLGVLVAVWALAWRLLRAR